MSQKQSARVLLYLFFIGLALLMLASLAIRPAPASGAEPTGRIGSPISTTKPPAEPRLTMPPTDTE